MPKIILRTLGLSSLANSQLKIWKHINRLNKSITSLLLYERDSYLLQNLIGVLLRAIFNANSRFIKISAFEDIIEFIICKSNAQKK